MPGDNCCIPLCGSCRRTKGLGIFKLPSIKKKHRQDWRKVAGRNFKNERNGQ